MPRYNINKIRSAGLRYIVADSDGQVWAFEATPVRNAGHWRLPYKLLCPVVHGDSYKRYWAEMLRWKLKGRAFTMPLHDVPFDISWEDEPYDIVGRGLVTEGDLKIWLEFRI